MYTIGIETSCDETSVAIVKNGRQVLSHTTASSLRFHKKYGGVIPEIAFRKQLETIVVVADSCVRKSGISLKDAGLISVTNGPGLLGSLVVGIAFAKALSLSRGIPLLGVNHLHSHFYANFLESPLQPRAKRINFPCVALVVSGGHTSLFYIRDFNAIDLLGYTQDDACGESFDKVAKILGLGYPGGPGIERLAKGGDAQRIKFRCSQTKTPLDFSFSGIKTAVLYYVQSCGGLLTLGDRLKRDIAASFQEAVIKTLIKKSCAACEIKRVRSLILGGGVAVNNRLRAQFSEVARQRGLRVYFPAPGFCLDNAAMVAGMGYQLYRRLGAADLSLDVALD